MNPPADTNPKGSNRGAVVAKLGGVVCVGSMVLGVIAMLGIIVFGDPERPSQLFGLLGGLSCGLFSAGLLLGFIGWLMLVNSSDSSKHAPPPERKQPSAEPPESSEDDEDTTPTPYDAAHRRR